MMISMSKTTNGSSYIITMTDFTYPVCVKIKSSKPFHCSWEVPMRIVFEMQRPDAMTEEPMENISSRELAQSSDWQYTAFVLGLWKRLRGLSGFYVGYHHGIDIQMLIHARVQNCRQLELGKMVILKLSTHRAPENTLKTTLPPQSK